MNGSLVIVQTNWTDSELGVLHVGSGGLLL